MADTNGTLGIEALLTEAQTECEAQKKRSTEWQEPCDPRANLPITYTYLTFPEAYRYLMTPEEHKAQCKSATTLRCYWQPQDYEKRDGYQPIGDRIPELKKPSDDIVRITHYTKAWHLRCPDFIAMLKNDAIKAQVAIETLSEDEYNQRMEARGSGGVRQRAIEASLKLKLPKPSPQMTWLWQGEMPYTLVNGPTWFATDKQTFTNRSQYARAGNTWVQVTAVPAGLSFTANGEPETWCAGPGVDPRDKAHMNNLNRQNIRPLFQKPPGGCSHRFERTSPGDPDQPVPGNMRIRWAISYVGSGNITGTLPDMYTNAPVGPFAITEMQTLVTK